MLFLHAFLLLYKGKSKVQQESATCLLSSNMLHFYPALFLGSLSNHFQSRIKIISRLNFFHNPSTISGRSEDVKQNKTMKLIFFKVKSATSKPCLQS